MALRSFSPVAFLLVGTFAAAAPLIGQASGGAARLESIERPGLHRSVSSSLQASIGYTRIEFDVNRPLAQAKGGLVPFTVKFDGAGNVASVQVPGSLSYPLGWHSGSFEQTLPNADIRAIMRRDEAAILDRCKSTLNYNRVDSINTVHDAQLPVTVNGPDGAIVASITVPYRLGLTCTR